MIRNKPRNVAMCVCMVGAVLVVVGTVQAQSNRNRGIPAVLERLDALQAQLAEVEASLTMRLDDVEARMHARLDGVDTTLAEVLTLVTPADFDGVVKICFSLKGGLGARLDLSELEGRLDLSGGLGIDFYGNGVDGNIEVKGKTKAVLNIPASIDASAQFCFDIPIPRLQVVAAQQGDFADAVRAAGEQVRDGLVDFLGELGIAADNVEMKVMNAQNLMMYFPPTDEDLLFLLMEGSDDLTDLIECLPINAGIKTRISDAGDMFPTSLSQLNPCSGDFIFENLPPRIDAFLTQICNSRESALRIVDLINAIAENLEVFGCSDCPPLSCCWCSSCPGTCILGCLDGLPTAPVDADIAAMIIMMARNFGPCPAGDCPSDVNGDGVVGSNDLLMVIDSLAR